MIGRTLAHYEILERLGEGGMGEVYLALDKRLDRKVALKRLPEDLAADPEALARFEREAKAVAGLNHPNIVTVHSVEEADGVRFLTMEVAEGETLDKRTPADGMDLTAFLALAQPLAEAVAVAHERGVTHRDLKPGNIMVSSDGRLKVLDFGLAKLLQGPAEGPAVDAPTEALTREGLVVGTIPYMSPEQVQGKTVDSRTDIFSLGIIFYEMLTGRRPFAGESSAESISALLRDQPVPVEELAKGLPEPLTRIVRRCLEKDPNRRFQNARDIAIELDELRTQPASGVAIPAAGTGSGHGSKALKIAGTVLLLIVGGALLKEWLSGRTRGEDISADVTPLRLTKLTAGAGLEDQPAWSPDGKFLAYTTDENGNLDILIQPIGGGQVIRAFTDEADEAMPAWSPDGQRIAFVSARGRNGKLRPGLSRGRLTPFLTERGGDLYVAPAFGGAAVRLANGAYAPTWSPDGERIAFVSFTSGEDVSAGSKLEVWTVSSDGGTPTRLTTDTDAYQPAWSPDGTRIAYAAADSALVHVGIEVVLLDSEEPPWRLDMPIGQTLLSPVWSQDGSEIYFASTLSGRFNIWRIRAPTESDPEFGEPRQVTFGGGADISPAVSPATGALAFATINNDVSIHRLELATGEVTQITSETNYEGNPRAAPGGDLLALTTDRAGVPEIWTFNTEGEAVARIGSATSVDFTGVWSPDGGTIAYTRDNGGGDFGIVLKELGSATERLLLADAFANDWSRDGNWIVAAQARGNDVGLNNIVLVSVDDGSVRQLTDMDQRSNFPVLSPDGREVIYQSEVGGARKLWRVSADGGTTEQLTTGESEDSHPRWSPTDPDSILFVRNHQVICILSLSSGEVRELDADLGPHVGIDYPTWSADGTQIYFSIARKTGDIYIAEK